MKQVFFSKSFYVRALIIMLVLAFCGYLDSTTVMVIFSLLGLLIGFALSLSEMSYNDD